MKKPILFLLSALVVSLILMPQASAQTPGQLIWAQTSNPSAYSDEAYGVAIDSSGFYIVGRDFSLGQYNPQWRIEKRDLINGNLIWFQTSNLSWDYDISTGVAVDSTGVYIVGTDASPINTQWRIEKRNLTDGSLIWFQTNNPSGWADTPNAVAVDSTGTYIVGWDNSQAGITSQWRIEKRNLTDGSLIWSQTSNPSGGNDEALGVAIDSTGVYIAGKDASPGNSQWRIEKRSLSDGSLIWFQTSNPSASSDGARGVAVDSTGIYIAGYDSSLGNLQWRIEKRSLSTGGLIWTQTSNPSNGWDEARGVAVDSTGVYIVGWDSSPGVFSYQWRIEKRNLANGSLIWSQTSDPSAGDDWAYGVAIDSTGTYIVGRDYSPGNSQWRIEKRYRDGPRLTVAGSPNIGNTITISLIDPLHANTTYALAMSFGTSPGIPLPDGRVIPLNFDPLLTLSIQFPIQIGLFNSFGTLNAQGQAQATWTIPTFAFPDLTVYLAFVTINPSAPNGIASISPAVPVTLLP